MSRTFAFLLIAASLQGCASDDASAATTDAAVTASCADAAANYISQCPSAGTVDDEVASCQEMRREYEPMDCGEAYARYVQCKTAATYDCDSGEPLGCDPATTYGACASQFASRTLCSRTGGRDALCPDGKFAYLCLGDLPPGCEAIPDREDDFVCCPSIASGESFFVDP